MRTNQNPQIQDTVSEIFKIAGTDYL